MRCRSCPTHQSVPGFPPFTDFPPPSPGLVPSLPVAARRRPPSATRPADRRTRAARPTCPPAWRRPGAWPAAGVQPTKLRRQTVDQFWRREGRREPLSGTKLGACTGAENSRALGGPREFCAPVGPPLDVRGKPASLSAGLQTSEVLVLSCCISCSAKVGLKISNSDAARPASAVAVWTPFLALETLQGTIFPSSRGRGCHGACTGDGGARKPNSFPACRAGAGCRHCWRRVQQGKGNGAPKAPTSRPAPGS